MILFRNPEQKKRFFGIFDDMLDEGTKLKWGAYALTEPAAGSDVAGIRTSCRKDGKHWVLNGRKCYITNGARASWNVVFATIDPSLGRAGHRAFVVLLAHQRRTHARGHDLDHLHVAPAARELDAQALGE